MTNDSIKVYCEKNELTTEYIFFNQILDSIIPEDKNSGLPSLKDIGFADKVFVNSFFADLFRVIEHFIREKTLSSSELTPESFKKEKFKYYHEIAIVGINTYYVSEEVLSILHLSSVPPFPRGNIVLEGDLLLLEPVFLRGKKYREI